jgi:hypothetical protein
MSNSNRRFQRRERNGGGRFSRNGGNGGDGGHGAHGNGGDTATATATQSANAVITALGELDPAARALLDLSLRWEMDDEAIASIGQTNVGVLNETRAEAVRLVTAAIDVPPAEELEYVRRGLAMLYAQGNHAVVETEPPVTQPGPEPRHDGVDFDELESMLLLQPEPLPLEVEAPERVVEPEPLPQPERVAAPKTGRGYGLLLIAILALAAFMRLWGINKLGLNSDEAVYAGQGAAIANDPTLEPFFPAFRAHPLLFQTLLSIGSHLDILEIFGRVLSAAVGVATVGLTYMLGNLLYGRRAGLVGALFMALMPYHVVVTRQILLDGPMVFFATLSLYLLARYAVTQRPAWLYAAGAAMGLTAMSKETSLVLLGAVYAFLALTPEMKVTLRRLLISFGCLAGVLILFPLSLSLAGKTETGGNYLAWQLFRRPNHDWLFYPTEVPKAIGFGVLIAAIAGLWLLRKRGTWRETLLLAWIVVPVVFFQLWPVKGFQYLLPIAPAVALLAARALAHWGAGRPKEVRTLLTDRRVAVVATVAISVALLVSSWGRIEPAGSATFLAGSGGVPGGREAGAWIRQHVPEGAQMLTVGPSMANIIQFYGHRKAYGLSVSPNPLNRNPSYKPIANPDLSIRSNELQYLVWDAFSASRSKFFSRSLQRYADRYHGRVVHTETVTTTTADGKETQVPVLRIYEVRP